MPVLFVGWMRQNKTWLIFPCGSWSDITTALQLIMKAARWGNRCSSVNRSCYRDWKYVIFTSPSCPCIPKQVRTNAGVIIFPLSGEKIQLRSWKLGYLKSFYSLVCITLRLIWLSLWLVIINYLNFLSSCLTRQCSCKLKGCQMVLACLGSISLNSFLCAFLCALGSFLSLSLSITY